MSNRERMVVAFREKLAARRALGAAMVRFNFTLRARARNKTEQSCSEHAAALRAHAEAVREDQRCSRELALARNKLQQEFVAKRGV